MVQNGIFWTIAEQYYIGYYPIRSYQKIKVYRVETMDMGRSHCTMMSVGRFCWNNGVSGPIVLIAQDMILW